MPKEYDFRSRCPKQLPEKRDKIRNPDNKLINNISDEAFAKEFYKNILLFYKKTKKKDIMKPILRALSYYDTKSLRLLATGNNKDEIISNVVKTVEKLIGGLTK